MSVSPAKLPSLREIRTEQAERHLGSFIRQAWPIVEPGTPFVSSWHIDCIVAHLEAVTAGEIKDLLVNIPPRHMKSLAISVLWHPWWWIRRPELRWLCCTYSADLAIRDNVKSRNVIRSSWYQERWGGRYRLSDDQNQKTKYENDRTGFRIATSVDGLGTGEGGDVIVVDDPHKAKEAESVADRANVIRWWTETMSTRRNDVKTGRRVVVMQRVNEADLSGHIIAEQESFHHLCLPARWEPRVYVPGTGQPKPKVPQPHDKCRIYPDPRVVDGELLCPARFDDAAVAEVTTELGPYAAAGQYQQRPVPRDGAVFKSSYFRALPSDFDEPRDDGKTLRQRLRRLQYWDTAFSAKQTADYTVGLSGGVDLAGNVYLLGLWRQRVDEQDLPLELKGAIEGFRAQLVGIEQAAYKQQAVKDLVRALVKTVKVATAITPVPVDTDKVTRAWVPAGRGKQGMIFADLDAPWWAEFEAELLTFPNGAHDDQVDALSGLVALAIEKLGEPEQASGTYGFNGGRKPAAGDWAKAALDGGEVNILRRGG